MAEKKTLAQLEAEYEKAFEFWNAAKAAAQDAGGRETAALNKMNTAQKALTAHYDGILKEAPRESDWGRKAREAVRRTA